MNLIKAGFSSIFSLLALLLISVAFSLPVKAQTPSPSPTPAQSAARLRRSSKSGRCGDHGFNRSRSVRCNFRAGRARAIGIVFVRCLFPEPV